MFAKALRVSPLTVKDWMEKTPLEPAGQLDATNYWYLRQLCLWAASINRLPKHFYPLIDGYALTERATGREQAPVEVIKVDDEGGITEFLG